MSNEWGPAVVVLAGVIFSALYNNWKLDQLSKSLNQRIDDLRADMDRRFADLRSYMDLRFKALEDRVDKLEHRVDILAFAFMRPFLSAKVFPDAPKFDGPNFHPGRLKTMPGVAL